MEVTIPEDIFRDIVNPEKTFTKELFLHKNAAGDANTTQRAHGCVIIQKLNDNVLKILVSDISQNDTNNISHMSMQTDRHGTEHVSMQTEPKHMGRVRTQTDRAATTDGSMQTVDKTMASLETQTTIQHFKDSNVQTIIKNYADGMAQAAVDSTDFAFQTCLSMLSYCDSTTQSAAETTSMFTQVEISTTEVQVQAVPEAVSVGLQFAPKMAGKGVQHEYLGEEDGCQTDLSMMQYQDADCQVACVSQEADVQTDISIALMEEATTMTEACGIDVVTQTEFDVLNMETQTTPDITNRESQTEFETRGRAVTRESDQGAGLSEDIMTGGDLEEMEREDMDGVATQTDPVTIIIGDARFLIHKLKSVTAELPSRAVAKHFEIEGIKKEGQVNGRSPVDAPRMAYTYTPSQVSPATPQRTPKPRRKATGSNQRFNCPLCTYTFLDSPLLYSHIASVHGEEAKEGHTQPRGREGKTTQTYHPPQLTPEERGEGELEAAAEPTPEQGEVVPTEASQPPVTELEPPVLEPAYEMTGGEPATAAGAEPVPPVKRQSRTYSRPKDAPEPALFEDLPEPTRSHPRNRVRRQSGEEETEVASPSTVKRTIVEVASPPAVAPAPPVSGNVIYEYECPHCAERYGSASHLYTHIKRAHKEDLERKQAARLATPDKTPIKPAKTPTTPRSAKKPSKELQQAQQAGVDEEKLEEDDADEDFKPPAKKIKVEEEGPEAVRRSSGRAKKAKK